MKEPLERIMGILGQEMLGEYKYINFSAIKDSLGQKNWLGEFLVEKNGQELFLQITRALETENGIIALGERMRKMPAYLDGKRVSEVVFYFLKQNREDPLTLQKKKKYAGKEVKRLVKLLVARSVLILDTKGSVHEGPGRKLFLKMEQPKKEVSTS